MTGHGCNEKRRRPTPLTYVEAYRGVLRIPAAREEQEARLNAFVAAVVVVPFSFEEVRRCAYVREVVRTQKRRVRLRSLNLVIAATARGHDLVLVTRTTDDRADVPGLTLNQPT